MRFIIINIYWWYYSKRTIASPKTNSNNANWSTRKLFKLPYTCAVQPRFGEQRRTVVIPMTSQFGCLELLITRTFLSGPVKFEIMRVDCIDTYQVFQICNTCIRSPATKLTHSIIFLLVGRSFSHISAQDQGSCSISLEFLFLHQNIWVFIMSH